MDLRTLRHIVMLAHHLHFRKAADALGLTQPALSKSIQLAEQRYGGQLFDRNRRAVSLTPMGRVFVEQAESLLAQAAEFEQRMARAAEGLEGKITFGMSPGTSRSCLPPLLRELASERPDLRVNVAVRRTSDLVAMLLDEEIEFLVCARNQMPMSANVSFRSFGSYSAVFLVRPGHPLLNEENMDIAAFPIIAAGPIGGSADELYKGLVDFYRYQPQMTVESMEVLAHLAETSDAIWMSSTFAAASELSGGTLVPLETPEITQGHPIEVGLFYLRHKTPSPLIQDITLRLERVFTSGTKEEFRETSTG